MAQARRPSTAARCVGSVRSTRPPIVISNVIGGGIFFVPVIVAQLVPNPAAMLGVWLAGGALAFAGAMAYAELAAVRPHAGGEYVYLRDAYGPLAAFLTGWTSFIAGFSGAIAASAVALADYVARFIPLPAGAKPVVVDRRDRRAHADPRARPRSGTARAEHCSPASRSPAIVLLIALGFAIGHGDAAHLDVGGPVAPVPWLLALVPVMFSYSGWNAAVVRRRGSARSVAQRAARARRSARWRSSCSTSRSTRSTCTRCRSPSSPRSPDGRLMDTVAERLFGFAAGNLLALFTIVSLAASISAMVLAGPRVYFAMARDGMFVRAAGRVHPRFHTPAAAIVAQACGAACSCCRARWRSS